MEPAAAESARRRQLIGSGFLALLLSATLGFLAVDRFHDLSTAGVDPAAVELVVGAPADPAQEVLPGRRLHPEEIVVPHAQPALPPVAVTIDALGIAAQVLPIATDHTDTLVPPADPSQVGWWRDGALPGAGIGRVLLTGHTVSSGGGVFDDLGALPVGATVEVATEEGTLTYVVDTVDYLTIPQLAARAEELFDSAGPERLLLVTCEGWDGSAYEGNTVVVASPIVISDRLPLGPEEFPGDLQPSETDPRPYAPAV
ncbi:class F sortase [Nocardioides limicola]|uniref:class F sortase n=1 Tax=Nocardioides limicola TaxID=2803368 RepID=UPI0027DC1E3D|nr:class F sortase [Nocardioides sp. DJM-14]